MTVYISLICAIIGLIIYFATQTNAKLMETGRIMFFCGLLAFILQAASSMTTLFK